MNAPVVIAPQTGPQSAFLASAADIAIYAGAAGAGKTFAGLISLAMGVHLRGYTGVAFRRTAPELTGGGSVWAESRKLYPSLGGVPREGRTLDWTFPSGATIEFRHLQHEADVESHNSKQYAQVLFEELTTFEESQLWYLYSRCRSTSGVQPFMRATCNPDPDSFVRRLIDWWIDPVTGTIIPGRSGSLRWFVRNENDGKIEWGDSRQEMQHRYPGSAPKSLTAIRATLDDNQALLRLDPEYRERLMALPITQRRRLLDGDWNARIAEGALFRRQWFKVVDNYDGPITRRVRAWDRAASEPSESYPDPDWTEGARIALSERNDLVVEDFASIRATPGGVWDFMRDTAQGDPTPTTQVLFIDPGAAGKSDDYTARRELIGHHVKSHPARTDKVSMAELWSPLAERGLVYVLRASWNESFFRQAEAFPSKGHDDKIDAVSLAVIELGLRPVGARSANAQLPAMVKPWEGAPLTLGGTPAAARVQLRKRYE